MVCAPGFQCHYLAVGEQIFRGTFSMEKDGARGVAPTKVPVLPQAFLGSHLHVEESGDAFSEASSENFPDQDMQGKTRFGKGLFAMCRAASRHAGQFGQPFGTPLPRTGFVFAKEAANSDREQQGFSCAGQVRTCTEETVNAMRTVFTAWTGGDHCFHCQRQDQRLWRDFDLIQAQGCRQTEQMRWLEHGSDRNQKGWRKRQLPRHRMGA